MGQECQQDRGLPEVGLPARQRDEPPALHTLNPEPWTGMTWQSVTSGSGSTALLAGADRTTAPGPCLSARRTLIDSMRHRLDLHLATLVQ